MTSDFIFERLGRHHDRASFDSGVAPLDHYPRTQAGQDQRRLVSACFVAAERKTNTVAGYCTLAMRSIRISDFPERTARGLLRYPAIPAALLGRLAVDRRYRGSGLGAALLWNAAARARSSEIAAFALLVDAKDDAAVAFYRHHGFAALSGDGRALFLPLEKVKARTAE